MGGLKVAAIIPTCGRPHDLAACLRSLDETAGPELAQVVIVDDAPEKPASVPQRIAGAPVELSRNPESMGAAASRNRALDLVHPDVDAIAFLDDDVRLPPEWFGVLLAELTPERGAITGPVRRFDKGLVARARQLRYDKRYDRLRPGQPVDFMAGGNSVIWRAALARAGEFPNTTAMSDTLLARHLSELGTPCHFVPALLVAHRNSKGSREACVAAWNAGVTEGRLRRTRYASRLARGAAGVPSSPDPFAAALNVLLDGVFLAGHATSRAAQLARRIVPELSTGRRVPVPSDQAGSARDR